tara:strand:+ start:7351 stop:8520 length:1170 start_codon:yes stop_codon:yes gene_type:complete
MNLITDILENDTSGLSDTFNLNDTQKDQLFTQLEYYHKRTLEEDDRTFKFDPKKLHLGEIPFGIKKDKGCHIVPCSDIFVGTILERQIDTQCRSEELIISNLKEVSNSIDEHGWKYKQDFIIVREVKPFEHNGLWYKYVLVAGHHRYYKIVSISREIPVLIGVFDTEKELDEFAIVHSNEDVGYTKRASYNMDDAKTLIRRLQRRGELSKKYDDVKEYTQKTFKNLKEREKMTYESLAQMLCDDVGVKYPQFTYDKGAMETELKSIKLNNVINTWSKNGKLDDNEERGYLALLDNPNGYNVFAIEYLIALADDNKLRKHNVYCAFNNNISGQNGLTDYNIIKKYKWGECEDRLDKIVRGAMAYKELKGGLRKPKWLATCRETDTKGTLY